MIQLPVEKPHLRNQQPDQAEARRRAAVRRRVAGLLAEEGIGVGCSARECTDASLMHCADCGDPYCIAHLTAHRCAPATHPRAVGA